MENLKTLIIQYNIVWEDKAANFGKLESQFLNKLKENEIDLIVLPEMFATGFTMNPANFWESENGETFKWLKHWAKKLNACLAGGLITKNRNSDYQNTFVVARPIGEIEQYHKKHLFRMGTENAHYVAGSQQKIIDIKGWKINLQVCYDLRFPVFSRNKIVNDEPIYDVLIYIANWPAVRENAWSNLLQSRAIENQCFVLGVNRVGEDASGVGHNGASAIVDPTGNYLQAPIFDSEDLKKVELYSAALTKARQVFPVLIDADPFKMTN